MVLYDAQSSLDFTSTNSFTHTPVNNPRGIWVGIAQNVTASDLITAVTYGGISMTRIPTNGFAADTASEPMASYAYFLGQGIPTGAQTVSITVASGTDAKTAWCMSVTATGDTEIAASGMVQEDSTNPSVTLATEPGYQGVAVAVLCSGLLVPSSITAGSGYVKFTNERDFGSQSAVAQYGQKSQANVVNNFTVTTEDTAACFAAIRCKTLPTTINNYQFLKSGNGMSTSERIR